MIRSSLAAALVLAPTLGAAQDGPIDLATLFETVPDPEHFVVNVDETGLGDEMARQIANLISDSIGQDHFYGAAAAYLPKDSTELKFHIFGNHHTLDAAEAKALAQCDEERAADDSPCRIIARILPEGPAHPEAGDDVDLSEVSAGLSAAILFSAERIDTEFADRAVAVAASQAGAAWGIAIGSEQNPDPGDLALDDCNDQAEERGDPRDCHIVAERPAGGE